MKYKLVLLNLKCYLSDESDGDEIFILMNGEKVWPMSEKYLTINQEETALNLEFQITKGDKFKIELWDFDVLSANDLLGTLNMEATSHGHFVADFHKTGSDTSKYGLEWEIG